MVMNENEQKRRDGYEVGYSQAKTMYLLVLSSSS
jgi:hypothetical protein